MRILAASNEHGVGWIVTDNKERFSTSRRPLYHHALIVDGDVTVILGSFRDYKEAKKIIDRWLADPAYRANHPGSKL